LRNCSALLPRRERPNRRLLVEVEVQDDALEVRIRADGMASLVGELRQEAKRMAA
jgi:hypothetical protein